jgi:hypothetical protein
MEPMPVPPCRKFEEDLYDIVFRPMFVLFPSLFGPPPPPAPKVFRWGPPQLDVPNMPVPANCARPVPVTFVTFRHFIPSWDREVIRAIRQKGPKAADILRTL